MADIAEYGAVINLVVILGFNLIVICGNLGINLLVILPSRLFSLFFGGGTMVIFYFTFVKSKRYLQIIERYKDESKKDRLIGKIIIISYIIISFLCLLYF